MMKIATADDVLNLLRQLPPRERLRVIAQSLPETERDLSEPRRPLKSLRGLWKDLDFDISAEEIDQARREAWVNRLLYARVEAVTFLGIERWGYIYEEDMSCIQQKLPSRFMKPV